MVNFSPWLSKVAIEVASRESIVHCDVTRATSFPARFLLASDRMG